MVWTELPSTYFTVDPVAFSKAAAWHFFELSTKVPPNVATTSSSPDAGRISAAVSRHISTVSRDTIMVGAPPGARGGAIIPEPRRPSQRAIGPPLLERARLRSVRYHRRDGRPAAPRRAGPGRAAAGRRGPVRALRDARGDGRRALRRAGGAPGADRPAGAPGGSPPRPRARPGRSGERGGLHGSGGPRAGRRVAPGEASDPVRVTGSRGLGTGRSVDR